MIALIILELRLGRISIVHSSNPWFNCEFPFPLHRLKTLFNIFHEIQGFSSFDGRIFSFLDAQLDILCLQLLNLYHKTQSLIINYWSPQTKSMWGTLMVKSCETTRIIDLYFGDPCGLPKLSLVSNRLEDPAYCSLDPNLQWPLSLFFLCFFYHQINIVQKNNK